MKKAGDGLTQPIIVRMSPKMKRQLAALAKSEGRSQANQIRFVLTDYMDRREAQK